MGKGSAEELISCDRVWLGKGSAEELMSCDRVWTGKSGDRVKLLPLTSPYKLPSTINLFCLNLIFCGLVPLEIKDLLSFNTIPSHFLSAGNIKGLINTFGTESFLLLVRIRVTSADLNSFTKIGRDITV